MDHTTAPDTPGILELLDANNGFYKPELPPLDTVFPAVVVNQIGYDGQVQDFWKVYLPRDFTFAEVQEKLKTAAHSWQSEELARVHREQLDVDAGHGDENGIAAWVTSASKAEWLYQVTHNSIPEKRFRKLDSEREWRAVRRCVVDGKGEIIIWPVQMHAEMELRKKRAQTADDNDEADFHNVYEMDLSSLPPLDRNVKGQDTAIERRRRERRRRLSEYSAATADAGGGDERGDEVESSVDFHK